jgi:HEAT repeat protein
MLWDALERGKSGVVARIVDTIGALPPAPVRAAGAAAPARLIDAHIETDGKVRSVLTRMGLLPEPDVPSVPANSRPEGAGAAPESRDPTGSGIKQHTPEIWKLWLGRPSAETDLCHALLKSRSRDGRLIGPQFEGPLLVEALLELVGTEACERLIEVLREAGPPESSPGGLNYDYNGVGVRQLAGGCGPSAASAVEEALTDQSIPVRIAACWAAGALEGASATAEPGDLDTDDLGNSALWPSRKAVPRDAIISNLRQGPPSLQVAAAVTSARLDLMGAAQYLTPLLREPPLLDDRHVILRETVLGALPTLSDVPETARQEIRRCARSDPSEDVRAAAARVLGATCDPDAPGLLARRIGDMPEVSRAAARALPQCTDTLSLSSFRSLVDRWLLRLIGSGGAGGPLDPISSTPDTLLEDILYHRLLEEDQVDPAGLSPTDEISPESLSASSGWFEMASLGLTVQSAWKALFNDGEGEEDASRSLEVVEAAFEELKEVAQADEETRVATAAYEIEEDDMPERALATCDRSPQLGRRLAALAYHSLGAPRKPGESSTRASGHQPLHERLRSVSAKPPPRERLRRVLWTLAREEGAGGALGLYVLALHGETRAEARLIDRLADGDFAESPLVWTLLAKTRPFCNRADEFLECALNPYLASSEVPLSQRWAAFTDAFSWEELRTERMAVRDSTWQTFFSDCVGAEDLLPWADRHRAALHLAYRCGWCGPLESLWEERAMSVEDVTEDERYAYARDMLWARAEDLWSELWARWPQEAELWGLRMLGMRGSMETTQHIETAMRKEAVPEQEAREAIRCIKKRSASQ